MWRWCAVLMWFKTHVLTYIFRYVVNTFCMHIFQIGALQDKIIERFEKTMRDSKKVSNLPIHTSLHTLFMWAADVCIFVQHFISLQKGKKPDGDVSDRAAKVMRCRPRDQWPGAVPVRDWRLQTYPAGGVQTATFMNDDLRRNKSGIANYQTQTVSMHSGDDSIALYFKDAPATFRKLYVKQCGEVKYTIIYGHPQCSIENGKVNDM